MSNNAPNVKLGAAAGVGRLCYTLASFTNNTPMVQVIDNRSRINGVILEWSHEDASSKWVAARTTHLVIHVLAAEDVEGFANLAQGFIGADIDLVLPQGSAVPDLRTGSVIRCEARMTGPGSAFVIPGTLEDLT